MRRWNETESDRPSYSCIEEREGRYESMNVVTNGASWGVDPGSVQSHSSFEDAVQETGLTSADFEEVEF